MSTISLGKFSSNERPSIFSTISFVVVSGVMGELSTISPLRITVYESQICSTSCKRWEIKITARFSVSTRCLQSRNSSSVSVSLKGAVGSSRIKKLQELWIARAIRTICFCASESVPTRRLTSRLMFRRLSTSLASLRIFPQFMNCPCPMFITMWLNMTFSATDSEGISAISTS